MLAEAIISFNRYIYMINIFNCLYEHYFNTYEYYHDYGYVLLTYSLARFLIANYTKKGPGRVLDPGLKSIGKQAGRNWPIWKILEDKP